MRLCRLHHTLLLSSGRMDVIPFKRQNIRHAVTFFDNLWTSSPLADACYEFTNQCTIGCLLLYPNTWVVVDESRQTDWNDRPSTELHPPISREPILQNTTPTREKTCQQPRTRKENHNPRVSTAIDKFPFSPSPFHSLPLFHLIIQPTNNMICYI